MARPLSTIASEISNVWTNVNYGAAPYLQAMLTLDSVEDSFGHDSGRSIVLYFLANASTFRGPDAKRLKAELKALLGR